MIPKFKAWLKKEKCFADQVDAIRPQLCEIDLSWKGAWGSECFNLLEDVELMQSTGLLDKNGKEIFEGDVIAIEVDDTETPINARVFQNSKIGVLMFHVFEDNEDVPMVELLEDNSVAFEIIGNIYETPELLEV